MKRTAGSYGERRRWHSEQNPGTVEEKKTGVPLEQVRRNDAVNGAQRCRRKRSLDPRLEEAGELVPKGQVRGLQKRNEELERTLGYKAWEVDDLFTSSHQITRRENP